MIVVYCYCQSASVMFFCVYLLLMHVLLAAYCMLDDGCWSLVAMVIHIVCTIWTCLSMSWTM